MGQHQQKLTVLHESINADFFAVDEFFHHHVVLASCGRSVGIGLIQLVHAAYLGDTAAAGLVHDFEHYRQANLFCGGASLFETCDAAESGGVYPKGLVVGTVTKIQENNETGTRTAYVEPAVDFTSVSHVYILMPQQ